MKGTFALPLDTRPVEAKATDDLTALSPGCCTTHAGRASDGQDEEQLDHVGVTSTLTRDDKIGFG